MCRYFNYLNYKDFFICLCVPFFFIRRNVMQCNFLLLIPSFKNLFCTLILVVPIESPSKNIHIIHIVIHSVVGMFVNFDKSKPQQVSHLDMHRRHQHLDTTTTNCLSFFQSSVTVELPNRSNSFVTQRNGQSHKALSALCKHVHYCNIQASNRA